MIGLPIVEPFVVGSLEVELPMVVDEIQDVESGKPDEAVEKEIPVGPDVEAGKPDEAVEKEIPVGPV